MEQKIRKSNRLYGFNYNCDNSFFITICVKDRKEILSCVVGAGVLDCPYLQLLPYGKIADKYINQLNDFYDNIFVDKYVIMPDHIHILLTIKNGQSGTPAPTNENKNSYISKFVSTFKRYCNKEYGNNIWQRSYYDHIIRNREDYNKTFEYIENNPLKLLLKKSQGN